MTEADDNFVTNGETLPKDGNRGGRRTIADALANDTRVQLLEIALVFSPVVITITAFAVISPENPIIFMACLWLANLMMLGLIWAGIRVRDETSCSIGLNIVRVGFRDVFRAIWRSMAVAVFALSAFVLATVVMAMVVGSPEAADMSSYNYLQGNLLLFLISLAGVYVVSSFGEEVVYRGFLITRLEKVFEGKLRRAELIALVTSSAVFGLAHVGWGAIGIVQTTCMGIALGISFRLTGRTLWPLIMAHACMDTLLLVPLYLK